MRILSPAQFHAQPWKNGSGITHEIVRWPDVEDYQVRISLAEDRAAGPFSRFPGYRRWSFLVDAAPITLRHGDVTHRLARPGDWLEIDGDAQLHCELPAGPTRLLNLLVREDVASCVGRGPRAAPVRFVFALTALPWLPAGHAAVLEPAELVALDELAVWLG